MRSSIYIYVLLAASAAVGVIEGAVAGPLCDRSLNQTTPKTKTDGRFRLSIIGDPSYYQPSETYTGYDLRNLWKDLRLPINRTAVMANTSKAEERHNQNISQSSSNVSGHKAVSSQSESTSNRKIKDQLPMKPMSGASEKEKLMDGQICANKTAATPYSLFYLEESTFFRYLEKDALQLETNLRYRLMCEIKVLLEHFKYEQHNNSNKNRTSIQICHDHQVFVQQNVSKRNQNETLVSDELKSSENITEISDHNIFTEQVEVTSDKNGTLHNPNSTCILKNATLETISVIDEIKNVDNSSQLEN